MGLCMKDKTEQTSFCQKHAEVRDFIQNHYTPYTGDASFLAGATQSSQSLWQMACELMKEEREKGVLDAECQTPASITSSAPAYLDQSLEKIVGFQCDKPLKRAIMPNGGWRVVEKALESYSYQMDPQTLKIYSKYRKTHNEGVFDVYTTAMRKARKSGIITGLPDAYGRGRIIGDYRRAALFGVDALIKTKQNEIKQKSFYQI